MAAISVSGLSDETMALLARRARERGVDLTAVVRELADLGLELELVSTPPDAPEHARPPTAAGAAAGLTRDLLGPLDTDDPDYLWT